MREPVDAILKPAAQYAPALGKGRVDEHDYGNLAGSVLMYLMLVPHAFALAPQMHPLRILGRSGRHLLTPDSILEDQISMPRSGHGPDNRRTNVLEALLNLWQEAPDVEARALRAELYKAWRQMRLAITVTSHRKGWKWPLRSRCVARHLGILGPDDLPRSLPPESDITDYEIVTKMVSVRQALRLETLAPGVPRAEVAKCVGLSDKNRVTSSILHRALERCREEGREHHGDLVRLFLHL